jgi:hypothetical protein
MLMDADDSDRMQRRLSTKQASIENKTKKKKGGEGGGRKKSFFTDTLVQPAQRNLDFTPEKDKSSRRPRYFFFVYFVVVKGPLATKLIFEILRNSIQL